LIYFNLPTLIKFGDFNMLKFERLNRGSLLSDKCRFDALVDEVSDVKVRMRLSTADASYSQVDNAPECTFKIRHVNAGTVLEGHRSLEIPDGNDVVLDLAACELQVTATLTRNIPKGKTKLDLSDVFKAGANGVGIGDIIIDGTLDPEDIASVATDKVIVTLFTPAGEGGAEVVVENFVLAAGKATTHGNAAQVALKPGKYQVHFTTCLHESADSTNMPSLTRLEFIKHCPGAATIVSTSYTPAPLP